MSLNQPDFQSLRNMRDNTILLSIANEYLAENVYIIKIGSEISKNLAVLKEDIRSLKRQFPGRFVEEINTEKILGSFEKTAQDMVSCSDGIKIDAYSGKLGTALSGDLKMLTDAIEKIWQQVNGREVRYTKTDSLSTLFSRLNVFPAIFNLFLRLTRIVTILFILGLAGFSYLYVTMEKEGSIFNENRETMAFIEEKKMRLGDLEKKKDETQKSLKDLSKGELLRRDKIAIIDLETRILELNREIQVIEGQVEAKQRLLDNNREKLEKIKEKSFLDRLFRR